MRIKSEMRNIMMLRMAGPGEAEILFYFLLLLFLLFSFLFLPSRGPDVKVRLNSSELPRSHLRRKGVNFERKKKRARRLGGGEEICTY